MVGFNLFHTQVDESDTGARSDLVGSDHPTKSDRNPGCGTTKESDGKIIITPDLIIIHLVSTMGGSFTQLSDHIGFDCRIQSDSYRITMGSFSDTIRSVYRF
jgi:hypothetical protein